MDKKADELYPLYVTNCVLNALSAYTAIMFNIVTIHAIRKTFLLPKPLKTLLLNLAVSDLGVGLGVQPLYITLIIKELEQDTEIKHCKLYHEARAFHGYYCVSQCSLRSLVL